MIFLSFFIAICPKGDNPETDLQNYRSIMLTVTGPLNFEGLLGFSFQGETTFLNISSSISASTVKTLLENSNKFKTIKCSHSSTNVGITSHMFIITFIAWPTLPQENNLYSHQGNPPLIDFTCDTSFMNPSVSCKFSDLQVSNLRGNSFFFLLFLFCLLYS